jgi:hypothetical protein
MDCIVKQSLQQKSDFTDNDISNFKRKANEFSNHGYIRKAMMG